MVKLVGLYGDWIAVNPDHVISAEPSGDGTGTVLRMSDGSTVFIGQDLDNVLTALRRESA